MNKQQYDEYRKSDAWQRIRSLVIRREQGLCQGCRNAEGTEVHHLTYERVGCELLLDLALLCRSCHERAHGRALSVPGDTSEARAARVVEALSVMTVEEEDAFLRERERRARERLGETQQVAD